MASCAPSRTRAIIAVDVGGWHILAITVDTSHPCIHRLASQAPAHVRYRSPREFRRSIDTNTTRRVRVVSAYKHVAAGRADDTVHDAEVNDVTCRAADAAACT